MKYVVNNPKPFIRGRPRTGTGDIETARRAWPVDKRPLGAGDAGGVSTRS
jgi:hypothetical protein